MEGHATHFVTNTAKEIRNDDNQQPINPFWTVGKRRMERDDEEPTALIAS